MCVGGITAALCGVSIGVGYGYHLCGGHNFQLFALFYVSSFAGFTVIYADDVCAGIAIAAGAILFEVVGAHQALAGTVVVAIIFTFLTGVGVLIDYCLATCDDCDESFRKLSILPYAFLFAPVAAPIVYSWGVL